MLPLLSHIWPHTSAFIPSFLLLLLPLTRLSSDLPVPLVLVPPIFSLFVSCRPVLSPQICIRASSQGLRLLCLLTCSSLSQVKSDPRSLHLKSLLLCSSAFPFKCLMFSVSGCPPLLLFLFIYLFSVRSCSHLLVAACLTLKKFFFPPSLFVMFLLRFQTLCCSRLDVSQSQGGDAKRKTLWSSGPSWCSPIKRGNVGTAGTHRPHITGVWITDFCF